MREDHSTGSSDLAPGTVRLEHKTSVLLWATAVTTCMAHETAEDRVDPLFHSVVFYKLKIYQHFH
jgi:hypothetical protein